MSATWLCRSGKHADCNGKYVIPPPATFGREPCSCECHTIEPSVDRDEVISARLDGGYDDGLEEPAGQEGSSS